jgi:N-acetylmuramoyl-L-alanine amidase
MAFSRKTALSALAVFAAVLAGCAGRGGVRMVMPNEPVAEIAQELRGVWVAASEWAHSDPDSTRARIDAIVLRSSDANFNAIFFQAKGQLVDSVDPGCDPLAYAVSAAHGKGLELYAGLQLPQDSPPVRENPTQMKTDLKRVVRHMVEMQDVDGLHFYPGDCPAAAGPCDLGSMARCPADSLDRTCASSTDLLEDAVSEALLVKPHLLISAATWMAGHEGSGSSCADCCQVGIDWLDRGIVDFLVPMAPFDMVDPRLNFYELWADLQQRTPNHRYILSGMRVTVERLATGETANQVNLVRRTGGIGYVMAGISACTAAEVERVRRLLHPNRVSLPDLKRIGAGRVFALDVSRILGQEPVGKRVEIIGQPQTRWADAEGCIGMILPHKPDTLWIATADRTLELVTSIWQTPYRYQVQPDGTVQRTAPWVELRRGPRRETTRGDFHFLFRTDPTAFATINDEPVKVYRTGVFFDSLGLQPGVNRVRAEVVLPDSSRTLYEREFIRVPREPVSVLPLWIESRSVRPRADLVMLPRDRVRVSFRGSRGQIGQVRVRPGKLVFPCARQDSDDSSLYEADLPLRAFKRNTPHRLELVLQTAPGAANDERHTHKLTATVTVREAEEFPLVETTRANAALSYSIGKVRLGGPYVAEYDSGVVLQTNGIIGGRYRVALGAVQSGYISGKVVRELPAETVRPGYHVSFLNAAVANSGDADVVRIPYPAPVPYAVTADPNGRRILVSLYGVKTSSTWIQHGSDMRYIDKLTWRQADTETYQVIINLKTDRIWGYEVKPEGRYLVVRLRYPPAVGNEDGSQPLVGLKIAIEAGHGGSNTGAQGLSGLLERDVNLDTALRLGELCRAAGMEVFQLRPARSGIPYMARRDSIEASDAHLVVSIHANSGGRGYLALKGTSTYYHNPFWAEFAHSVYDRLLELGLDESGMVGSFNYRNIRITSRPAILVEQAFMSHAEDEERLADAEFRRRIAEQIFAGIADYAHFALEADGPPGWRRGKLHLNANVNDVGN